MKCILALLVLSVTCALSYGALTCMGDAEKCPPEQCCVQRGMIGLCKPKKQVDEPCDKSPLKNFVFKHVYKVRCPCADGLKCVGRGGLSGKLVGKCQASSEENPDEGGDWDDVIVD